MRHAFKADQWVPYPVEKVFAFFANPENLPRLMPKWQKARIERANYIPPPRQSDRVSDGVVAGAGSQLTISFRPLPLAPIRMHWEAVITEFTWNDHFCDEQPKGPFAYWRHCHRVSIEMQRDVIGTRVVDDLVYEVPLGILAEPAHWLFVRRQVENIFAYRQRRLLELLG
jgi:ligand-binding SRPBCC domain-containing protein